MLDAVCDRLADLRDTADRLVKLLNEHEPHLPGLLVCQVGIVADKACSRLERLLADLQAALPARKGHP